MEDSDSESVRTVKELPDDTAPKPAAQRDDSGGPSAEAANRFYFQEHLKKNLLSINPSALQTLETLMQEIQNTSRADPEILKSCELRWLQLFKLVEKQYQDQILSQQDQYQCQIQLIQDEIKALIQLQNEGGVKHSTAKFPLPSKHMDDLTGCDTVNGHHVEELRHSDCGKAKGQLPATSQCTDEEIKLQDSMELNCASEQNFPSFDAINETRLNTLDNTQTMKEKDSMQFQQNQFSLPHLKENGHQAFISAAGDKHSFTLKFSSKPVQDLKINQEASNSKSEMEIKMETESQLGKQNNANGLTSWVQKVKQKNWKSKSGTRASCDTMQPQGTRQLQETERTEGVHLPSARSSPNCSFYLSRPSSSPNSLVSSVSGLSYWKMDEGELYHALPNNKETDVLSPSKTVKALRLPAGEIPSLKEIYCMKQRDRKHLSGWGSCSPPLLRSPPQVLTLDPTLHMKRPTPFSPHDHCSTPVVVSECDTPSSVSPDSLVGVTTQSYCHPNLGSCVRTAPESELTDTSRYTVRNSSLPSPDWNLHSGTQSSTAVQGQHYLSLKETGNSSALAGQEGNSTITPTITPVPCVELRSGNNMNRSLDHNVPASSLEDPVMLSVARLNLREKHARHVADIRAYYEAEISSLKEKLDTLSSPSAVSEAEKQNQNLSKRCEQLEGALTEAAKRIRDLENKNYLMEMQLAEWPGRYDAVSTAAKALQQRLDEMRKDSKEKDNMVNRLNSRLKDLEEAFERAYKHSDNKDARLKQEHKMLQDLLTEYESLGKEHERVKGALNTTEDKLYDANSQISELKRVVSKLEAQIRQADHERSYMKVRTGAESCLRTSNNSLFNHHNAYHSPVKSASTDVARRKWLTPGSDYSIFTGRPLESNYSGFEETHLQPRRYHSPPEKDHPFSQQDSSEPNPPILKALKQLDSRKSTENWGVQAQLQDVSGAGDNTKVLKRTQALGFVDSSCSKSQSVDLYKGRTRSKGNSSPSGQRSSSVPPSSRKSTPTSTPTKRNTLLTSLSAKSSPKRCPKENLSPGFNHLLGKEENPVTRFDINLDEDDFAESVPSCGSSPRKRLQFFPLENTESRYHVDNAQRAMPTDSVLNAVKMGSIISRPAWEDKIITAQKEKQNAALQTPYETELTYKARIEALGETEKLFDALTQEKQQIEAALSRIPGSTGRMTLQARLEKEALEDRLEKINRDLGSVRMTLKRFHILRTSANL
ncbi:M-phase phosphoprotein 9 isoform X2 [Hypanus sabinus]|uniref:M-phase phosphoprotein 9 isoform X2 n=1 Tax=Hypanus sabinus TaxID=79690 RepID=UPI0028C3ABF3|nr:M-phase phosphoprotein 9 isoform X2 [Hypanus sabinus]